MLNALTIDFEDWYQGLEIPMEEWPAFEDRVDRVGPELLDLLAEHDARATFFVLGAVAERYPELVREIARRGHEIATHGWSHTLVYEQSPEGFRAEIRRSIDLLGELSGRPVVGHRAPFFSITSRSLWALDVLSDEGVLYDSSIFPVRNPRYGISDASPWPHEITTASGTLHEFPITTWPVLGQKLPVAGGAYFRIWPYALTRRAFRSLNANGRAAVFYLHPWELDPEHPRIPLPRRIALTHYYNLGATRSRFARLLNEFRFAPMGEILNVS